MKVDVYRNLHTKNFSVRYKGKVIHRTNEIFLKNAQFIVSQAGRERVIREKRKNVHAVVRGVWVDPQEIVFHNKGYYNPYLHHSFVDMETGISLISAETVLLYNQEIYYAKEIII